jgi:hypothetical protein
MAATITVATSIIGYKNTADASSDNRVIGLTVKNKDEAGESYTIEQG